MTNKKYMYFDIITIKNKYRLKLGMGCMLANEYNKRLLVAIKLGLCKDGINELHHV